MSHSLVGFLKSSENGLVQVEFWLQFWWGKMHVKVKLLDPKMVWMQFLHCVEAIESSLFIVVETWIEVLGMPLWPICVLFIVVPLYVWRDGVLKQLEGCMTHTTRVDLKSYMAE